jgi:hypothetical protein
MDTLDWQWARCAFRLPSGWLPAMAALLGLGFLATAVAQTGGEGPVAPAARLGAAANLFRLRAGANLDTALREWATADFRTRWDREVGAHFATAEAIQWHDFFSSAIVLLGAVGPDGGIVGFYNPWIDGLLLAHLAGEGERPRLQDFLLVAGESWRGEPPPEGEASLGLYRDEKVPLAVGLARRYAPTVEAFTRHYPPGAPTVLRTDAVRPLVGATGEELAAIKARMLVRMVMFGRLTAAEGQPVLATLGGVLKALRAAERAPLVALLSTQAQDPAALENVLALPAAVRALLAPNYVARADGVALVGLVNPSEPRWVAVLRIAPGGAAGQESLTIETFDLELSRRILDLWKEARP